MMMIRRLILAVSVLLVLAVLVLNVALILQNRKLKQAASAPPQGLVPTVGSMVKRLEGTRLNGSHFAVPFDHDSAPTLLLVFSVNCHFCDLNWSRWTSLAQSLQGRRVRIVYVNHNSPLTTDYLQLHGVFEGQVYNQLDPKYEVALNLRVTPLTVLLDANGRVENVWAGVLDEADFSHLQSAIASELLHGQG
jgi:hypothetical protein